MAQPALKQDTTTERLAGLTRPEGGWSEAARGDALARVTAMGLPHRRDEYWKYTRPDALLQPAAPRAEVFEGDEQNLFSSVERIKVVFVDGVFDESASDDLSLEGVTIERLGATHSADIHWASSVYGTLEAKGQEPVERPFAALNTAFATDGLLIHVTGKPSKPINLIYLQQADESDAILHHVVRVEAGAELTLLEQGPAAARFNTCTEVDIADGGVFHHVRAQGRNHDRTAATHMVCPVGPGICVQVFHGYGKWSAHSQ